MGINGTDANRHNAQLSAWRGIPTVATRRCAAWTHGTSRNKRNGDELHDQLAQES